ncbi:MAG: hypothetical protein ABWW66_02745 [Archaeoglobaceae archaeon]
MRLLDPYVDIVRKLEDVIRFARIEGDVAEIDASDLKHKELNDLIKFCAEKGAKKIVIRNVCGQRYIGSRLFFKDGRRLEIEIHGYPGNDLGAFLAGHRIVVYGNAQDGVGNTMDDGEIVVHGRAGDVVAMAMRGGRIMIRDDVGYRTAIHMKEYREKVPVLIVGGTAQDFLGEYMAGGRVILLGLNLDDKPHRANYIGTGMHGGIMYIRGRVERWQFGKEVGVVEMEEDDWKFLEKQIGDFCSEFAELKLDPDDVLGSKFVKLKPVSVRPYGKVYSY